MNGRSQDGREEQCSIVEIPLPESSSPIVEVHAQNLRSHIKRANGEIWFWGGFFYEGHHKLQIVDFNLLQEEPGLPEGKNIVHFGMGFAHDTVLVDNGENEEIVISDK